MASFKALCLAGVAGLVATAANAADLLPPPAPVYAPPPPPVVIGNNWYLRGDGGIGIADFEQKTSSFNRNIPGINYDKSSLADTGFIDAGVGYRFNEFFRADITGEYRIASQFSATESFKNTGCSAANAAIGACAARGYDGYIGSVSSVVGLVNGYIDVGTWYGITPFIGGGVGIARVGFNNVVDQGFGASSGGYGFAGNNYQNNFAWAAMAGVAYSVTPNLKLEIGYRYLNEGNIASGVINCTNSSKVNPCAREVQHASLAYNDIRLGFRYTFADFVPPPIPAFPLVRKY